MADVVSIVSMAGATVVAVLAAVRWALVVLDRRSRRSFLVSFPRELTDEQLRAALRALHGLLPPAWQWLFRVPSVVIEAIGTAEGIAHRISATAGDAEYVLGQLKAALPGVRVTEEVGAEGHRPTLARELRPVGSGQLRTENSAATNSAVLAALQPLRTGQHIVVQWVITPVGTSPLERLVRLIKPVEQPTTPRRAPEPPFLVTCRVGAQGSPSASLGRVLRAFGAASTEHRLLRRRLVPSAWVARALRQGAAGSLPYARCLDAGELAAVLGIPLAGPQLPGLTLTGARELPPLPAIPRSGRVLGDALGASGRPVALSVRESARGLLLTAPTGGGKSTVLENLCAADFCAGRGVIVIESKGDLIDALCDLIPPGRVDDVVVFDPSDASPVGFNLLSGGEDAADLIADHTVGQFKELYASYLGPRSEMLLRASLLTLSRAAEAFTICEVIPLLTEPAFRRRLLGGVRDHVLAGVWAWFEGQTEAAQAEMTSPLVNKLAAFTLRPKLRAVVGQAQSGLDFGSALAEGKIVLVSLSKGLVGQDAAGLLGSCLLSALWNAVQARAATPAPERRFVSVVCDEAQDFLRLPVALGDAVAQSRGMNVGWTVSHQNLGQLSPELRRAVLANLRSKVVMQTTADDAHAFAREFSPHLSAADLQGLGAYEAYAALSVGAAVAPPASIHTRRAPTPEGHAAVVRARSRARYGRDPWQVEADLLRRLEGLRSEAPVGARRRS